MTKINQKPLPASLQLTDEMPLNRSGADYRGNFQKVLDLMIAQGLLDEDAAIAAGFLIGDPSAIYAENQSDGKKWQIGGKNGTLTAMGGVNFQANLAQQEVFTISLSSSNLTLNAPANIPTSPQIGLPYGVTKWTVYAINLQATDTGELEFTGDFTKLADSKPYFKGEDNSINIIHCYTMFGHTYYKIENSATDPNEVHLAEGIITSAQILDSNTNPVELIPAPGAGKMIMVDNVKFLNDTGANYSTNTSAYIRFNGQQYGADLSIKANGTFNFPTIMNGSLDTSPIVNKSIIFETNNGNPENGTFDIWYSIKYRIVDYPFV